MAGRLRWEVVGPGRWRLAGVLDHAEAPGLLAALEAERGEVVLELGELERLDTAGAAALLVAKARRGGRLWVEGARGEVEALLRSLPAAPEEEGGGGAGVLETVGVWVSEVWETLGASWRVGVGAAWATFVGPWRGEGLPAGAVARQAVQIGVDALPITALISFLVGLIIAFQAAFALERYGATLLVANMVGLSMVRELGPLITGILLAGRSGSAIAAELGSMVVQEEVAAMEVMGLAPSRHLVAPRLLAILWTGPLLALLAMAMGILGGLVIGVFHLHLPVDDYMAQTWRFVKLGSLANGLFKSFIFSGLVGLISCASGLGIKGGSTAVGRAATRSVVASITAIVIADSLVTALTVRTLYGG